MFGLIITGRPISTNLKQIDATHFTFQLENAQTIKHLVVFLLNPLPVGFKVTVHLHWPSKEWVLLGILSNDKPSAIFKVTLQNSSDDEMQVEATAELGLSIEPDDGLPMVEADSTKETGATLLNAIEYFCGFVQGFVQGENVIVPFRVFNEWYMNVKRRLANDKSGKWMIER